MKMGNRTVDDILGQMLGKKKRFRCRSQQFTDLLLILLDREFNTSVPLLKIL